ncbi:MAG: orotate phosphoribosyltransferase [Elusimicrobia bacterium]|nr:orotate phosphoribosyltransferase [Elusimicrobiota bacterium]
MSKMQHLDVVGVLQEHGAILSGHFQLPSGFHSQSYVQTSLVMQYPNIANKIAKAMSAKFPQIVDVILAPNIGSVVIGQEIARVKKARSIFAEKSGGSMILKHNFKLKEGEKVLLVDDVITTGNLTAEAVSLAMRYGAKVVGVVAIVDRSTGQLPLTVPVRSLINYPLLVYPPDKCPLCAQGIALTTAGSIRR